MEKRSTSEAAMMHWFGPGPGFGAWVGMGIFWLLLVALIVWLVMQLATYGRDERTRPAPRGGAPWLGPVGGPVPVPPVPSAPAGGVRYAESPFEILDRRLAAGEIDVPTYQQLRAALLESRGGQP